MTAESPPERGEDGVTEQLFHYARDLKVLMQQHSRLLDQHQMLLASLGHEVPGDHLLHRMLAKTAQCHWVTDSQGRFLPGSSRGAQDGVPPAPPGTSLMQGVVERDSRTLSSLLKRLSQRGANHGAVQLRLHLRPPERPQAQDTPEALDALLVPLIHHGMTDLHWYLYPAATRKPDPLQALMACVQGVQSGPGAMLASPEGDILAANASYCQTSGYSLSELLGNNPRMLGSGRHSTDFFHDFWFELLDSGCWSGTLFNRRKRGPAFLTWQTLRMVEDSQGRVVAYLQALVDLSSTRADIPTE